MERHQTIGDWQRAQEEHDVREALATFDPTLTIDVIAANHGGRWSIRPISHRVVPWLEEFYGDGLPEFISPYSFTEERPGVIHLIDALHDAGFKVA